MTGDVLPASVLQSELTIAGVTLKVHHLDDGRRVLEREGVDRLLEAMEERLLSKEDAIALAQALRT
jgi:hypothetical protein